MNTYFKVIDDLQEAAIAEPFINKVTQGDITEIDLNRSSIYPLCHLQVQNASVNANTISVDVAVILMDLVDISKEEASSDIRGNNNEMDVLNTQLSVAARLHAVLERKSDYRHAYQLDTPFSCEFFTERFENNLAGVAASFTVTMPNTMTSC